MQKRLPNILLTIADDQRGSALGCADIEPVLTPALDALAARGARFAHAQHFGSCHGAICAPSRAMLHTGHPYFHLDESLVGERRPPGSGKRDVPLTLGSKLRQAGYHSFATGKWHNGSSSFHSSFDSGANIFFGGMADHWFTPVHDFDSSGRYPQEAARIAREFSTELFARSAIDFLRSRHADDQPFFCYCAFTAPHDPRTPPDHWRRRYDPNTIPLPPNITPQHFDDCPAPRGVKPAFEYGIEAMRDELLLGTPRDSNEIQRAIAEYYGMISHMDEWIGHIHRTLEEIGELDNTIVVHTSDHGLAIGQHGLLGKQNLYQHSLAVPLLLAGPDITPGVFSSLCYQHDLHQTLTELAGTSSPPGYFRNLFDEPCRTHIGSAFGDILRSVRDTRHKLIQYRIQDEIRTELFDLERDPWETNNLAARLEHRPVLESLRRELCRWQEETGDTDWPVPELSL